MITCTDCLKHTKCDDESDVALSVDIIKDHLPYLIEPIDLLENWPESLGSRCEKFMEEIK